MKFYVGPRSALFSMTLVLAACSQSGGVSLKQESSDQESPLRPTATIQDLMHAQVDPAADFLWESVGTTVTQDGEVHQRPRTDVEWRQVRNSALALIEASNLLATNGRRVVAGNKEVEDAHVEGVSNAKAIQAAIDGDRATWVAFTQALHGAGKQTLKAIDARNPDDLLIAGEALDAVCEACHLKYWYPNQVIPTL